MFARSRNLKKTARQPNALAMPNGTRAPGVPDDGVPGCHRVVAERVAIGELT